VIMSKRLAFLQKLTAEGSTDAMAWYGLAMEYKSLERIEDSLTAFCKLRQLHPDYVAMYLMCGNVLASAERKDEARSWLNAGIALATSKRDSHALGELETALASIE
jgi:predicted Zn-dependent protease